ncbi:hypothetical protein D3C87_1420910 [compost metagenome]
MVQLQSQHQSFPLLHETRCLLGQGFQKRDIYALGNSLFPVRESHWQIVVHFLYSVPRFFHRFAMIPTSALIWIGNLQIAVMK